jgi:hypothetical protein
MPQLRLVNSGADNSSDFDEEDPVGGLSPNPSGRNQYLHVREWTVILLEHNYISDFSTSAAAKDDVGFQNILREYHKITTSRCMVARLLQKEHGIDIRFVHSAVLSWRNEFLTCTVNVPLHDGGRTWG